MAYRDIEKNRAWHREYRRKNVVKFRARAKAYRLAHIEEKRAIDRRYYARHRKERCDWQRAYRKAKGAPLRELKRARTYGISVEELRAIVAPGRCEVCGATERLHIDHCHATGRIRGLLCRDCNRGLGCFRDNPDVMGRAAEYLREHHAPALRLLRSQVR